MNSCNEAVRADIDGIPYNINVSKLGTRFWVEQMYEFVVNTCLDL